MHELYIIFVRWELPSYMLSDERTMKLASMMVDILIYNNKTQYKII